MGGVITVCPTVHVAHQWGYLGGWGDDSVSHCACSSSVGYLGGWGDYSVSHCACSSLAVYIN